MLFGVRSDLISCTKLLVTYPCEYTDCKNFGRIFVGENAEKKTWYSYSPRRKFVYFENSAAEVCLMCKNFKRIDAFE